MVPALRGPRAKRSRLNRLQPQLFQQPGHTTGTAGLAPIGRMVFGSDVFEQWERLRSALSPGAELDDVPLLHALAARGGLVGVPLDGPFYDAGVPEGYTAALAALSLA